MRFMFLLLNMTVFNCFLEQKFIFCMDNNFPFATLTCYVNFLTSVFKLFSGWYFLNQWNLPTFDNTQWNITKEWHKTKVQNYLIRKFRKKNHLINIMSFDNNLTLILDKRNFSIKDDIGNASNTTSNNDADDPNFGQHNITAIVVLTLIYGLLSLTACVGNLLVIWIIGKYLFVYFCSLYFLGLNYLKSFERKIYFVLQQFCCYYA